MPLVIGLLEERERVAALRVEVLREGADRPLAELQDAERDWERFVVSRETVVEVLVGLEAAEADETPVPGALNRRRRARLPGRWCRRGGRGLRRRRSPRSISGS